MKYIEDKRRKLNAQPDQGQTVPQQSAAAPVKAQTPAQKQTQAQSVQPRSQAQAPAQTVQQPAAQQQNSAAPQLQTSSVVEQAQQYLNEQLSGYNSRYGSQITDLVAQLQNRPAFEYDVSTDPLYLQLRDIWRQDGLMAMEDTMGQASQLTGGYGNSHSQMLGQQAYQGYMRQFNSEMVPQLREQARADYDTENADLLQKLGLLMDQEDRDYSRWMDELERQRYDEEQAYSRGQDAYDRLAEMIAATGYKPTAEELTAAGMTEEQAKAWRGHYTQSVGGSDAGTRKSPGSAVDPGDGGGGDPVIEDTIKDQLQVMAGNGASKEDLLDFASEALSDGDISKDEYAALEAWIEGLDDNPNEPVRSGYTGKGYKDLGMPLHNRT